MTVSQLINFLNIIAVYFTLQLGRCIFASLPMLALVLLLRKTCLKNTIFLKGMAWGMFLLIPFLGRLKLYYQGTAFSRLFHWWTDLCMSNRPVSWIYMAGILVYSICLFRKRREIKKIVIRMKRGMVGEQAVYISDMCITPFTTGVIVPRIVLPEVMVDHYTAEELKTVILHEKTHIRLGHLWLYFLWDIFRCIFWINPLFTTVMKYLQTDMEDICDKVSIQKSGRTAYDYGTLLLKSMKLLQTEQKQFSPAAAYIGEYEYTDMKKRMQKIVSFQSYKRNQSLCLLAGFAILLLLVTMQIKNCSYSRWNANDCIVVCNQNGEMLLPDSKALHKALSYDDKYLYINTRLLSDLLDSQDTVTDTIWIGFGGYYKLPGIGGGSNLCMLKTGMNAEYTQIAYDKDANNDILGNILKFL